MKEFDYNKAKAGAPVCTREGRPVRIVCWDALNVVFDVKYPIVALIEERDVEYPATYTIDGHARSGREDPDDLMMATTKHEGWINVYRPSNEGKYIVSGVAYETESEAKEAGLNKKITYITTIKIEWEEDHAEEV